MRITGGRVFGPDGQFREETVYIADGRLASAADGPVVDATGCYVVPGFIDIHIHGAAGWDVCDGRVEALSGMARYLAGRGVTAFLGATMAADEETLCRAAEAATAFRRLPEEGAVLWGLNMEGPFFAAGKKGAQNAACLRLPDAAVPVRNAVAALLVRIFGNGRYRL